MSGAGRFRTNPPKKSALDKATLEAYVRHLFVMDKRISIQVSRPAAVGEPARVSWKSASMRRWGTQAQDFQFLVSKDGSKILQGNVFDVNNNPVQERSGQAQDGIRAESRRAGRGRRAGGVLRLPVPVLQGRGDDAPAESRQDLSAKREAVL